MNDTIDRYKQDLLTLRDKNADKTRLQAFTESMEEEETPSTELFYKVVVTAQNHTPIPNASVLVTSVSENGENLNYFLLTDCFGKTETFALKECEKYTISVSSECYNSVSLCVLAKETAPREIEVILTKTSLSQNNAEAVKKTAEEILNRRQMFACCSFPLRQGDKGECVKLLQEKIAVLANVFPCVLPPRPTGNFGENTAAAVECLQRIFSLNPTGCADELTFEIILDAADTPPCNTPESDASLLMGDKGSEVLLLQLHLKKISVRFKNVCSPELNGCFDEHTQKSVCELQRAFSMPQTSRVGSKTMQRIIKLSTDTF